MKLPESCNDCHHKTLSCEERPCEEVMTKLDDAKRLMEFLDERTFFDPDDWNDLGAVKNKLVEMGKWKEFDMWSWRKWRNVTPESIFMSAEYEEYLIYPPTFNRLVSEFLEQDKEGL